MIAVIALLALRIGLQYCLLHEEHDAPDPERVLCPHCDHVVPDMAFCPNCGVAAAAASRTSRTARRAAVSEETAAPRPGYAIPAGAYGVTSVRQTTQRWLLTTLGAGIAVVVAAGVTASSWPRRHVRDTPVRRTAGVRRSASRSTPIRASSPPTASSRFSTRVPEPLYKATLYPDWVALEYFGGDTGTLELWGEPADKRTPKQVVDKMIADYYPDATIDYEIPNAMVGYEPGYGAVFDEYPQDSSGEFTRLRLVALCAVKNDYALVASAIGPYHEFTPDFGTGHPSACQPRARPGYGQVRQQLSLGQRAVKLRPRRRAVNLTGIEWMPFISVDRTRSTGPASSRSFIRDSTSGMIAVASTRARFAPRQKWVPPPPKARCGFGARPMSKRSGSAKWVSSRLADG